jgi:hypothetical protein
MKFARTSLTAIAVSIFALQGLAMTTQTADAHAINTKGCVCPKGKTNTIELPSDESAAIPIGLER